MKKSSACLLVFSLIASLIQPGAVVASNGGMLSGYGMKSKGMGGAAVSLALDSFASAINPAAMSSVGNRFDFSFDYAVTNRGMSRTGSSFPVPGGLDASADSSSDNIFVPEFGYNRMFNEKTSWGLTLYSNGGLSTDYNGGQLFSGASNVLLGSGKMGVFLGTMVLAPSVAYKVAPEHSIGVAPLIGYQRFRARGLDGFDDPALSKYPGKVTNNGFDSALGYGVRVGYLGHFLERLSIGLGYSTKIYMGKFDKYKGLFADGGKADVPENYDLGFAVKATDPLTFVFDYQKVRYSKVPTYGNASQVGKLYGDNNGPGFGWKDLNVYKFGLIYDLNPKWQLRGGYSHGASPVRKNEITGNILAPATMTDNFTLGATFNVNETNEITFGLDHQPKKSLTAPSGLPVPGGTETIHSNYNSFGVQWGLKFK